MIRNIVLIGVLSLVICRNVSAQVPIDSVLAEISRNNKTIQASRQYFEAQKLQYKSGITPPDPTVEYDFLAGSPAIAGEQHDLTISQQFEFPTAYIRKSQLSDTQVRQIEFQFNAARQDVLLEAKKYCIELVYLNKIQLQLSQQKLYTEKLLKDFQTKMDKGDASILDVNKAKLQLIETRKSFQQNISEIARLQTKLSSLNAGIDIVFTDTTYFSFPALISFTQLEAEYEDSDPVRKTLEQEKFIAQKQLELSKAQWLPRMELGYHYQGILGQTYNGVHTGISIPLWENKNKVKLQQAKLLFAEFEISEHKTRHYYEIKALYEKYGNLKIILEEYKSVFFNINSTALLNKALALGEINTIQYFMEINYYNESLLSYLETEKEYYLVVAELYKYKL